MLCYVYGFLFLWVFVFVVGDVRYGIGTVGALFKGYQNQMY